MFMFKKGCYIKAVKCLVFKKIMAQQYALQGADTVIYERLSANGRAFADTTLKHLEEFAQSGLRTLCFASVDLSERSYKVSCAKVYRVSPGHANHRKVTKGSRGSQKSLGLIYVFLFWIKI